MLTALLYGSFVGLSLGLTGGGGALFAIPLLVYGLGFDFRRAVAISLSVIGLTALYGAILQARKGFVLWRAGALLGIGGIITAPLGTLLGALLPERVSLLMFTALMTLIGVHMFRNGASTASGVRRSWLTCECDADGTPRFNWKCASKLLTGGAVTGLRAGVFGVGGGFLRVPALLLVTAVSIERATGTSLVAMFLISVSGVTANVGNLRGINLELASWFLGGSFCGVTTGSYLKTYLPSHLLRKGFAVMVLATAAFILARNL